MRHSLIGSDRWSLIKERQENSKVAEVVSISIVFTAWSVHMASLTYVNQRKVSSTYLI
jgi:hypothetical protein